MQKDIRFLLVFLIIAIGVLVWLQCYHCNPVPNAGQLKSANTQHFTVDNKSQQSNINNKFKNPGFGTKSDSDLQSRLSNKNKGLSRKIEEEDRARSSRESQKVTSKIVDSILKNETEQNPQKKSRFFDESLSEELEGDNYSEGGSQLSKIGRASCRERV